MNAGIFYWLADPTIQWISTFQDDVDVHPRVMKELARVQHAETFPLLCGRVAPDYLQLDRLLINGVTIQNQWAAPGQHFHGHRHYWETVLPIPTTQTGAPKNGRGSEMDWWITVMAPGSLGKQGKPIPCLPNRVRSFYHQAEHSTWGSTTTEDPPLCP